MSDETTQPDPKLTLVPPVQQQAAAPEEQKPAVVPPSNFRAAGPLNPSLNEDLNDSRGDPKTEEKDGKQVPITKPQPIGPRGVNVPPEHLTEARKAETAEAEARRLQQGMSSTDAVDSRGVKQGTFEIVPGEKDAAGVKQPDTVTDVLIEAQPAQIGPRGVGAPPETYHGKKGLKKVAAEVGHELKKAGEAVGHGAEEVAIVAAATGVEVAVENNN